MPAGDAPTRGTENTVIVISGILLLVAVACLVVGLFSSLVWVYISIGVSVLSFVFLLLGVRQRKELPAAEVAGPAPDAGTSRLREALGADNDVTVVASPPAAQAPAAAPAAVPAAAPATARTTTAAKPRSIGEGGVLIVPGRPRYHVPGCRYLSGREIEPRSRDVAIAEGFTACGVCRPDEALAQASAAEAAGSKPVARRRPAAVKATANEPAPQPAKPPARQPAKAAPVAPAVAKAAAAKRTTAASATRAETVVAVPERGKFHRPDCRYARGVASAQEMTKAQASRQGYQPCGSCKP
jgi:hypothetical protein